MDFFIWSLHKYKGNDCFERDKEHGTGSKSRNELRQPGQEKCELGLDFSCGLSVITMCFCTNELLKPSSGPFDVRINKPEDVCFVFIVIIRQIRASGSIKDIFHFIIMFDFIYKKNKEA